MKQASSNLLKNNYLCKLVYSAFFKKEKVVNNYFNYVVQAAKEVSAFIEYTRNFP